MSLNPRAIATLGVGFGATAVAYLGLWPVGTPVEPPIAAEIRDGGGARLRGRVLRRVEREIDTAAGRLRVDVPEDWTAQDLRDLATILALSGALD